MDFVKSHLLTLSQQDQTPSAHKAYLIHLYNSGFQPKVIYDIGACVLHWTKFAKTLWPNASYVIFDAFDKAEFLYTDYQYHLGVLGNEDFKEVKFYQNDLLPTGNSYYREIGCENGRYFPIDDFKWRTMRTLDSIVQSRNFPLPDLIKIDVQGAERDIVQGGARTIKHAKHLIVEMQHSDYNQDAPKFNETIPVIENLGFTCVAPLFCNNGPDGDYGFVNNYVM